MMMKRYLEAVSQTRSLVSTALLTVAISFGVFTNLPNLDGLLIDLSFGYDAQWIINTLVQIGEEGRATYRWAGGVIDMIFPLFYVSFFAGMLYRFRLSENLWWLSVIPMLAGVVDWGENIQIQMMIDSFPNVSEAQASTASLFTQTKWILVRAIYGLIAISLAHAAYTKVIKAPSSHEK